MSTDKRCLNRTPTRNHTCRLRGVLAVLLVGILPMRSAAYKYFFRPIEPVCDSIARVFSQLDYDNERTRVNPADLERLGQIARQNGHPQLRARALYWQVRMTQMGAQPSACIKMLEEALRLTTDTLYDYDRACIQYQLAGNCDRMGEYMQTYELLRQAIPVFQKYKDYYFLGNAYLLMGQLFLDINYEEPALEQIALSRRSYERAHYPLNRIYFFEALAKHDDSSLALYKKSVATGDKDWGMTLQALASISTIFLERQQPDSAEYYCNQGFNVLHRQAPDNQFFYSLLAVNRVKVLYQQQRYDAALEVLRTIEPFAKQLQGERMLTTICEYLWKVNDRLGRSDDAYKYLNRYQEEYERTQQEIRRSDIPKTQAREAIARQQDQIQLLQKDAELSRNYLYVALLVALVILITALALFFYFRQRVRMHHQENRELQKSLEQEALIYNMNRQNFENDIKQKDCEISSSTLLLANKNEVLQQLSDITRRFSDEGKIPREYVQQVNNVIGDSLRNDDEWSRFKLHFDSVHPDFFVKLKQQSPDLTENDLRLCAYIRIGMRAKQIAEMLSVTPDSVNTARYRLRKKLGLSKGQSLDDHIRQV